MVDVPAVPHRLEDAVGETEHQDVLNRLLPQVVIDPVHLVFPEVLEDLSIQGSSGLVVVTKGLFDDEPPPTTFVLVRQATGFAPLHDQTKETWWGGHVIQVVAACCPLRIDPLERGG